MPKSDNKHAVNMYNSLEKHIGREAADEFVEKLPLSKSADYQKRFKWAGDTCAWLEERFTDDDIKKMRAECACDPGGKAERAKKLYEASADYDDFCAKFNSEFAPENTLTNDGSLLYFAYPKCYCSCVKRGGDVTRSWCVCTVGYTEKMFSRALSREVKVELLESIKTGGTRCLMKITAK